jgi:thiamine biosynthesis protein ThiI
MTRIAGVLAGERHHDARLTGDSVAQVASQTLRNMDCINRATEMLILRPLTGMDKQEITTIARRIGTYDVSADSCPDSCTVFAPRSPATGARVADIENDEARLDVPALVAASLAAITVIDPMTMTREPYRRPDGA